MKLIDILKEVLLELDNGMDSIGDEEDLLQFPHMNFTVSIFRDEKKLLFSPQNHQSIPNKIRTLINDLKQTFRISDVVQKEIGTFEVTLDPRTDLDSVIDFIKQELESDGNF